MGFWEPHDRGLCWRPYQVCICATCQPPPNSNNRYHQTDQVNTVPIVPAQLLRITKDMSATHSDQDVLASPVFDCLLE